jgi:hypothetical protein
MRKVEKLKYTKNLEKWDSGNNRKRMEGPRKTVTERNGGGSDPENKEDTGDKDEKRERKSETGSPSVSRRYGIARRL